MWRHNAVLRRSRWCRIKISPPRLIVLSPAVEGEYCQLPLGLKPRSLSLALQPQAASETYGPLTRPLHGEPCSDWGHMRHAHTTLNFLPDRSFPIGTSKAQFLTYIAVIHRNAASCLRTEQLYQKSTF